MPNIQFYNSLAKSIEPFEPVQPGKVRIYNCGPTVYKRQHIGNMRRFLFADFLRRTLELLGFEVREIMNITDVGHLTQDELDAGEYKLEKEAREQHTTPQDIAEKQTELFFTDLKALNIEPAHKYPRATRHIESMQEVIATLIKNGFAYSTPTGVYFDVQKFPQYGALSGNTLTALNAGARVDVREEKRHPADFALWIVDETHLQRWNSPWGTGYPGWHIECSAMALEYLGSNIDIHTGGEDNRFPHHENEIAQSESATGEPFVRFWMHNSHLQLEGKKLAKREGVQVTLDTIREKGFSPLAFRLLVFGAHYRTNMDFSWELLESATKNLDSFRQLLRQLAERPTNDAPPSPAVTNAFKDALSDDLNTPKALAVVMEYISAANSVLTSTPTPEQIGEIHATLAEFDHVLGIIGPLTAELESETIPKNIQDLADKREQARKDGNFERADELRGELLAKGYTIEDTPSGPRIVRATPNS